MKHLLFVASLFAAILLAPSPVSAQSGCGIQPIKPIPPIGYKDLVAECRCEPSPFLDTIGLSANGIFENTQKEFGVSSRGSCDNDAND